MEYSAELLERSPEASPRRRRHPRQTLRSLAYVKFDDGNGGIVRDLTESGIAVQAVRSLNPGQEANVRFELLSPRVRVETRGRVAWANTAGQGGIQFIEINRRMERALRNWQLTQMFLAASVSGRDSMFSIEPFVRDLAFSTQARPTIVVEPAPEPHTEVELPPVRWRFLRIPGRWVSIGIDSSLLFCAALVFAISSVAVMGGVPDWPIATVLFLTSSTIFVAVYEILFSEMLAGVSPGKRLARFATREHEAEENTRFR